MRVQHLTGDHVEDHLVGLGDRKHKVMWADARTLAMARGAHVDVARPPR
jgi:hypothetical protein